MCRMKFRGKNIVVKKTNQRQTTSGKKKTVTGVVKDANGEPIIGATVVADAFDGRGNYALGVKEQLIFPEIEYDKIDKIRGMDIVMCTTAQTDEEARELLKLIGAPFAGR